MSTISTEERREVARRLRELDYSDLQESLICAYLEALGIEGYADWVGIAHRLADLIEPPTQCPYYRSDRHYCSAYDDVVDRDALLALADELDSEGLDGWASGPVGTGRYARRIRAACDERNGERGVDE